MTKSYDLKKYPDVDYTPNDMGLPENNGATWDDFSDMETNEQIMRERNYF